VACNVRVPTPGVIVTPLSIVMVIRRQDVEVFMHFVTVPSRRIVTFGAIAGLAALTACDQPTTAPAMPLTASAARGGIGGPLPTRYVLPGSSVFPEGIAYDQRTQRVFVSSTTNGAVFAGHASEEDLAAFLPPGADGPARKIWRRFSRRVPTAAPQRSGSTSTMTATSSWPVALPGSSSCTTRTAVP
jgi:hypothetical protein